VAEKLLACNTGNEEEEWCNVGATFQSLLSHFIDRFKWELTRFYPYGSFIAKKYLMSLVESGNG